LLAALKGADNSSLTEIEKFRKEKKIKERNEKIKNFCYQISFLTLICFLLLFLFNSYENQEERINSEQAAISISQETNSEE
jgi:hypothetical protein